MRWGACFGQQSSTASRAGFAKSPHTLMRSVYRARLRHHRQPGPVNASQGCSRSTLADSPTKHRQPSAAPPASRQQARHARSADPCRSKSISRSAIRSASASAMPRRANWRSRAAMRASSAVFIASECGQHHASALRSVSSLLAKVANWLTASGASATISRLAGLAASAAGAALSANRAAARALMAVRLSTAHLPCIAHAAHIGPPLKLGHDQIDALGFQVAQVARGELQ